MMDNEVLVTSFREFELLINNRLEKQNIPPKHKELYKNLMEFSFRIGSQVAVNGKATVKL